MVVGGEEAGGSGLNKLDQFDPLFLHSSDTSGIPLISFNWKVLKTTEFGQLL